MQESHMQDLPAVLEQYLDAVWMERGLADNSLASYRSDLALFARWLGSYNSQTLSAVR